MRPRVILDFQGYRSMLFSFNLLTIYSAAFLCTLSYLDFLRWAVSHASSVYRCAVFPLSRNSGCSGARGSDGQYSSNMVHGIGDIFCCHSFLLNFVHLRVGPGILHLYTRTIHSFIISLSGLVSSRLSRRPSFCEGRVIGLM